MATVGEHSRFLQKNDLVYDSSRLHSVKARAQRIFLTPILTEYENDSLLYDVLPESDKHRVQQKACFQSHMIVGLDGLARELFDIFTYAKKLGRKDVLSLFPECLLEDGEKYNNPCYSDIDLLYGLISDLGVDLVSKGAIFCIVCDGRHKSVLSPEQFADLWGYIGLPLKNDWWSPYEVSKQIQKELGADKLLFSFVRDCIPKTPDRHDKKKTGHVSIENHDAEKVALNLLNDFLENFQPKRISKADAEPIIISIFKLTGKGFAGRVWENRDGKWKGKAGRIPEELKLNSSVLKEYYQQNKAKYVIQ